MPVSVEIEREAYPPNRIKILLEANSGGVFASSYKYRQDQAHIFLTVDGKQIQPSAINNGGSIVEVGGSDMGRGGDYKTYFNFEIPESAQSATLSVIGSDGNERTKPVDPEIWQ